MISTRSPGRVRDHAAVLSNASNVHDCGVAEKQDGEGQKEERKAAKLEAESRRPGQTECHDLLPGRLQKTAVRHSLPV